MKQRLDHIESKVFSDVGIALYWAHRFEFALVTFLLVREKSSGVALTADVIAKMELELKRMTMGEILNQLDGDPATPERSERSFQRALDFRNYLAHNFFKSYAGSNPLSNKLMLNHLELIVMELKDAVDLMQQWTSGLASSHGIDVSDIENNYEAILPTFNKEG